jgi:hypothetical protein
VSYETAGQRAVALLAATRVTSEVSAAAEVFAVDASRIGAAISYYGDYVGEIDAEIIEADEASVRAEARDSAGDGVPASRPIR